MRIGEIRNNIDRPHMPTARKPLLTVYRAHQRFENRKFHEILTLVTSEAMIFNVFFVAGVNFIACGARLAYYYLIRRAVLPQDSCLYRAVRPKSCLK